MSKSPQSHQNNIDMINARRKNQHGRKGMLGDGSGRYADNRSWPNNRPMGNSKPKKKKYYNPGSGA